MAFNLLSISLRASASIQRRTSHSKFGGSYYTYLEIWTYLGLSSSERFLSARSSAERSARCRLKESRPTQLFLRYRDDVESYSDSSAPPVIARLQYTRPIRRRRRCRRRRQRKGVMVIHVKLCRMIRLGKWIVDASKRFLCVWYANA